MARRRQPYPLCRLGQQRLKRCSLTRAHRRLGGGTFRWRCRHYRRDGFRVREGRHLPAEEFRRLIRDSVNGDREVLNRIGSHREGPFNRNEDFLAPDAEELVVADFAGIGFADEAARATLQGRDSNEMRSSNQDDWRRGFLRLGGLARPGRRAQEKNTQASKAVNATPMTIQRMVSRLTERLPPATGSKGTSSSSWPAASSGRRAARTE